jgi:uncharacterized SAM-binding protein YcdF (DUF218 family)
MRDILILILMLLLMLILMLIILMLIILMLIILILMLLLMLMCCDSTIPCEKAPPVVEALGAAVVLVEGAEVPKGAVDDGAAVVGSPLEASTEGAKDPETVGKGVGVAV